MKLDRTKEWWLARADREGDSDASAGIISSIHGEHMTTDLVKMTDTSVTLPLKWYDFSQNNSGGRFHYTNKVGTHVYIQATSQAEATAKALEAGVYFDGCAEGRDCKCCGDRWYEPYSSPSEEMPQCYMWLGKKYDYRDYALLDDLAGMSDGYVVFHFYNGDIRYGIPMLFDGEIDTRCT